MLCWLHHFIPTGKPRLSVDPQSSVYTGDTVTLSCEPQYQSTNWTFFWKKDSDYVQPPHHLKTYNITLSYPGETEFRCLALRLNYQTEDSDPVRITVRGMTCFLFLFFPHMIWFQNDCVILILHFSKFYFNYIIKWFHNIL